MSPSDTIIKFFHKDKDIDKKKFIDTFTGIELDFIFEEDLDFKSTKNAFFLTDASIFPANVKT